MEAALPIGSLLASNYRIEKVLGQGGFGITYKAVDETLGRAVAIKEYFPEVWADRDASYSVRSKANKRTEGFAWGLERFEEEGRRLAKLSHKNIVHVHSFFRANGTAYMVLAYEEGETLNDWYHRLGRPPTQAELDRIMLPLLDALETLHNGNMLHRDIAPDNIFIRADGSPVLIDFGSAREEIGRESKILTSVVKSGFSPLEQYDSRPNRQGPFSDIYSFAATLYAGIAGKAPPPSPDRFASDDYVPAAVAADGRYGAGEMRTAFLSAIDWALRLLPAERPQTVESWRQAMTGGPQTQVMIPPSRRDERTPSVRPAPQPSSGRPERGLPHQPSSSGRSAAGRRPAQLPVSEQLAYGGHARSEPSGLLPEAPPPRGTSPWVMAGAAFGIVLAAGAGTIGYLQWNKQREAQAFKIEEARRIDQQKRREEALALVQPRRPPEGSAEEARRKAEMEAEQRQREDIQRRREAEIRTRAEAEARRKAEAEVQARFRAEEEVRRRREAELQERLKQEAEARRKAEEDLARARTAPPATPPPDRQASLQPGPRARDSGRSAPVHECDRLAASPFDQERAADGVSQEQVRARDVEAVNACRRAVTDSPGVSRFEFQLARALNALATKESNIEAVSHYRRAAERGHLVAMNNLGLVLANGIGTDKDDSQAASWYRRAAEKGLLVAMDNLASMLKAGRGTPQDPAEAYRWALKAAEGGFVASMNQVGEMLRDGQSVARNDAEAVRWIQRAADRDYVPAMLNLARLYVTGTGVPKDLAQAARWNEKAAKAGDVLGMYRFALMLEQGAGMPQNYAEAARWMRLAASKGHALSMNAFGVMLELGRGIDTDEQAAANWYKQAAERGDETGMTNYALMLASGRGVERNDVEAVRLFRAAADKGDQRAIMQVAFALANGRGVEQNADEAARIAYRAIESGNSYVLKEFASDARSWSRAFRTSLQRLLQQNGLYSGRINGQFNNDTREAIAQLAQRRRT